MKPRFSITIAVILMTTFSALAQEVQSIFGGGATGGYGALSTKLTNIRGDFANVSEVYGGVFINRRWMLGIAVAGSTNDLRVPVEYSTNPLFPMTYQYAQGGMKLERVFYSNLPFHFVVNLFSGVGFTGQYNRNALHDYNYHANDQVYDQNWFYVIEPGAQLELNLFRWMRLSPGISYRKSYGSEGLGLSDSDLSDWTYNVTLKFGGFGRRNLVRPE